MSDLLHGLPVHGYRPQTTDAVKLVNQNKEIEEYCLRRIEALLEQGNMDPRCMAEAKTCIQTGFMWMSRGVFKPGRVRLPGDQEPGDPA